MLSFFDKIRKQKLRDLELAIFWLGQNSFIIKTSNGTIFAIDLYLSRDKNCKYVHSKPPIKPEDFKGHYVFCTHDHLDHTDPITLPIIAKNSQNTMFFGPSESCKHLIELGIGRDRVKTLEVGVTYNIGDLRVTPYYSVAPEEVEYENLKVTHFGYIFEVEGIKVYNMGDTSKNILKEKEKLLEPIICKNVDIAMLPIVGDIPQRKPEDAFLIAKTIKPKIVIPSHYNCFKDRTIDPKRFIKLFKEEQKIRPVVIPYKGVYIYSLRNL
ncbi:MAG: MBL fold metallo-hydrolase [Nitrososphaeria archaeon]